MEFKTEEQLKENDIKEYWILVIGILSVIGFSFFGVLYLLLR